MTYVRLDPEDRRPVKVRLDDGTWVPGTLQGGRRAHALVVRRSQA